MSEVIDANPADEISNEYERDSSELRHAVERVMNLYLQVEYFTFGSAAGRMVIDESRVGRRRPAKLTTLEPTNAEERDAWRNAGLRRALYAPVAVPQVFNDKGILLLRVIAAREIAPIVKGGASRGASPAATDRRMQLWKSTIATKFARMTRSCWLCSFAGHLGCTHVVDLLNAADLKLEIDQCKTFGDKADRDLGSSTARKRLGKDGIADTERDRASSRMEQHDLAALRMKITRAVTYREATDLFFLACNENPATLAYCFREGIQ